MKTSLSYRIIRAVVLTGLAAFSLFPLYTLVTASLQPSDQVALGFRWIPSSISFQAYVDMWDTIHLLRYLINSTFVSLVATVIAMVFGLFAAYAISRHKFWGRR